MPYGLEFIPGLASRFGSSAAGLTLRQAPRAVTSAAQSFNPVVQVPALFSRFGRATSGLTLRPPVPTINPAVAGGLLNRGMTAAQFASGGMLGALGTALTLGGDTPQRTSWSAIPPTSRSGGSYRDAELRLTDSALRNFGPGYRESELRAGAAAEAFRPGAGFPGQQGGGGGGSPAAERAYRQEVSRVAQLAAQNPELTRYQTDAAAAAKSGDQARMDAVRDRGMEMWAKANRKLAAKVKPGQSGYDAIQRTLNAGTMGSPMNFPFDSSNLLASAPAATAPSYGVATPSPLTGVGSLPTNAFAGATATPYSNMLQGQTLESAPLAIPSVQPTASYGGAQNFQGIGAPLTSDEFATDKARQLKDMYLKAALGTR